MIGERRRRRIWERRRGWNRRQRRYVGEGERRRG